MPVSKDHGGDSIAIKALKSINSPFLMHRDGFVLSSQRHHEELSEIWAHRNMKGSLHCEQTRYPVDQELSVPPAPGPAE